MFWPIYTAKRMGDSNRPYSPTLARPRPHTHTHTRTTNVIKNGWRVLRQRRIHTESYSMWRWTSRNCNQLEFTPSCWAHHVESNLWGIRMYFSDPELFGRKIAHTEKCWVDNSASKWKMSLESRLRFLLSASWALRSVPRNRWFCCPFFSTYFLQIFSSNFSVRLHRHGEGKMRYLRLWSFEYKITHNSMNTPFHGIAIRGKNHPKGCGHRKDVIC